jgi:hypothetical protein
MQSVGSLRMQYVGSLICFCSDVSQQIVSVCHDLYLWNGYQGTCHIFTIYNCTFCCSNAFRCNFSNCIYMFSSVILVHKSTLRFTSTKSYPSNLLTETYEGGISIFRWRRVDNSIGGDNAHDLTTMSWQPIQQP